MSFLCFAFRAKYASIRARLLSMRHFRYNCPRACFSKITQKSVFSASPHIDEHPAYTYSIDFHSPTDSNKRWKMRSAKKCPGGPAAHFVFFAVSLLPRWVARVHRGCPKDDFEQPTKSHDVPLVTSLSHHQNRGSVPSFWSGQDLEVAKPESIETSQFLLGKVWKSCGNSGSSNNITQLLGRSTNKRIARDSNDTASYALLCFRNSQDSANYTWL